MNAHSEEEARTMLEAAAEARKPWFEPVEDGGACHVYGACMDGPCKQGHAACPTPQACQVVMWDVERELAHSGARMFGRLYSMVRGWLL